MNDRITMHANICHGKALYSGFALSRGKRLEWLAGGMSIEDILADYEDLEREDILAVLDFAARLSHINHIETIGLIAA